MANEEQAVLDFFAQKENLPLALSVAEQADGMRLQLNHAFWLALRKRIAALVAAQQLPWRVETTEDRNAAGCLVGLHLQPETDQPLYLRPMLEQQYLGNTLRIYYGLMWSATPAPDQIRLSAISTLRDSLQVAGFNNNESFVAWQWTPFHPRRRDFLLRFSSAADALLDEATGLVQHLLVAHDDALYAANTALRVAPRSAAVSLGQLRANLQR